MTIIQGRKTLFGCLFYEQENVNVGRGEAGAHIRKSINSYIRPGLYSAFLK